MGADTDGDRVRVIPVTKKVFEEGIKSEMMTAFWAGVYSSTPPKRAETDLTAFPVSSIMEQLCRGRETPQGFVRRMQNSSGPPIKESRLSASAKWLRELVTLKELDRCVSSLKSQKVTSSIPKGDKMIEERRIQSMISCMVKYAAQPEVGDTTAKITMRMSQLYTKREGIYYGDKRLWKYRLEDPSFLQVRDEDAKVFVGVGLSYGIRDIIQQESLNMPTTSQIGKSMSCIANAFSKGVGQCRDLEFRFRVLGFWELGSRELIYKGFRVSGFRDLGF